MTTYVQARDALVNTIHGNFTATYPTTDIFYENTIKADLDKVTSPFVRIEIDFEDALQSDLDLDPVPGQEIFGTVFVTVFVKDGAGTRTTLALIDYFNTLMAFSGASGVHVGVPRQGKKIAKDGWMSTSINLPFRFFSRF